MSREIFLISDTHFNHGNIIHYCNRPFNNSKEMDEYMIEKWNSVVRPQDKVYHLGDVYMGSDRHYISSVLKSLNGHKRLVLGNHDDVRHPELFKNFKKISVWRMFPEFGLLLTHIPVHESSLHKTGRRDQPDFKLTNVHGHVHNNQKESREGYVNVSVEVIDYTPVPIESLRVR